METFITQKNSFEVCFNVMHGNKFSKNIHIFPEVAGRDVVSLGG
jgi:hypothetical protein